ncbi:MAG: hypothetical protein EU536_01945 [Promethearchaeota archaeon]|nr:MAG: hypothetical protein EU536_01945 [Candidatus Lokiarchaeota archaeon]
MGLTGLMAITEITSLVSLFGYLAVAGILLTILLIIWMPERKRLRTIFIISWIALWSVLILFFMGTTGSAASLHSIIFLMTLPAVLVLTITWYFCYFQKRLSVINPLLVGIGFTIYFISILLRVYVTLVGSPIGYVFTDLHWIPLLVDITAFSVMLLGFSRQMNY